MSNSLRIARGKGVFFGLLAVLAVLTYTLTGLTLAWVFSLGSVIIFVWAIPKKEIPAFIALAVAIGNGFGVLPLLGNETPELLAPMLIGVLGILYMLNGLALVLPRKNLDEDMVPLFIRLSHVTDAPMRGIANGLMGLAIKMGAQLPGDGEAKTRIARRPQEVPADMAALARQLAEVRIQVDQIEAVLPKNQLRQLDALRAEGTEG